MLAWAGKAASARPKDAAPYAHLAAWHLQFGHFAAAWDAVNAALARDPAEPTLFRRAAELSARQGDLHQAFTWLERAIALRPDAATYGELASLHMHAGNLPETRAALRKGLSLAPADPALLRRLAYVEAVTG
jgi:Flp pilus assembly protein TadD